MAVNLKIVSQVVASGIPGPAGKSAYQIAVDNGFEGTESEWLKELHPFKGWFDSVSELEDAHENPSVGEYAYVKGATSSDPVKIYECSTEGSWSDSGRTVDTSTVQTFRSGEAVNNVGIDNKPTADSINLVTSGGVASSIEGLCYNNAERFVSSPGGFYSDDGSLISTSQELGYTSLIPIKIWDVIKYTGQIGSGGHGLLIYSNESTVIDTAFTNNTFDEKEYIVTSESAKYVRCQGRNANYSPELSNPYIDVLTPIKELVHKQQDKINSVETLLDVRTLVNTDASSNLHNRLYYDDGTYADSYNIESTKNLIPISLGEIIEYTGSLGSGYHGILFYSDENTIVDTLYTNGDFNKIRYTIENSQIKYFRAQGRSEAGGAVYELAISILTPVKNELKTLDTKIEEKTNVTKNIATSQVSYVYSDDGSRTASSNYNGTTDGLIPVTTGDVIVFTGMLSASRYGLLFYSDENTVVATSLTNGTFTNEKVIVENPSIRYFRAQALNANYDPSITTQLSVGVIKTIITEVKDLDERVTIIEESLSVTPDIVIEKIADVAFDVKVKQESNGKYLTHRFLRHRYSRLVRYGTTGEATHEEICGDCWYPSQIYDGTTDILQGNANFINYVANKENEQSYAGEGHGATISDYVHFFADGVEFDPNTLTGRLECGTFRMVEKNVIYAIDTTQPNFNSDNAIPKFDESGNKEISTIHWLDGVWEKNNIIKYRHRLTIKRDNTQFSYCFGAMLEMEKDNFTHIIINDADGTENLVSYANNQWTCAPINGSSVVLQSDITNKGDEIVGFGTKYIVRQRMLQALTDRAKISSMFPRLYTGGSYRVKFYQQPVVTTANYAAVGLPTETFDDGDVVELFVERSIEFTE